MFCQKCGKEIKDDIPNFCPACGEKISNQIEGKEPMYKAENAPSQSLEKKVWYRVLKIFYIFSYICLLTLGFVTLYDDISSNLANSQIVQIQRKLQLRLPDGRIIAGIPEGITEEQVLNKLIERGILSADKKPLFDEAIRRGLIKYENEANYGLPDGFVLDEQSYQEQSKSEMKPWERFGDKSRQGRSVIKVFVKPFLQFLLTLFIGFLAIELIRTTLRYVILGEKTDNPVFLWVLKFFSKLRNLLR